MANRRRLRILVVGDSYCPSSAFQAAFEGLADDHAVTFADVTDEPGFVPGTPSELGLKEYMGSPAQVIAALDDHDVLVVQGAPVSDAVLDAAPALRLVCCARGGPVNVDVAAATARGIPVVTTPGKNADAVAELTIAFMVMLARRLPEVIRHVESGGEFGHDNYEGAHWFGHDLAGHTLGIVGFGQIGRRVATRAYAFGMPRGRVRSVRRPGGDRRGRGRAGRPRRAPRAVRLRHPPRPRDGRQPRAHRTGPGRPDEARELPGQHRPRHARRRGARSWPGSSRAAWPGRRSTS